MPLKIVRNASYHHKGSCAIFKPVIWLYEKDERGTFVYDFIGEDCDCGASPPPRNVATITFAALAVIVTVFLVLAVTL